MKLIHARTDPIFGMQGEQAHTAETPLSFRVRWVCNHNS